MFRTCIRCRNSHVTTSRSGSVATRIVMSSPDKLLNAFSIQRERASNSVQAVSTPTKFVVQLQSNRQHPGNLSLRPATLSKQQQGGVVSEPTGTRATKTRSVKLLPSKNSGGVPNPNATYMTNSHSSPSILREPQHLLVVIDLNGTLLYRPTKSQPTKFVARPHTQRFLQYCIDTFTVVIWSSARPENVQRMCEAILSPEMKSKVAAIWGREKFGLSKADYNSRVQCYKRLTKLWDDKAISEAHPEHFNGGRWDQTNTVLVDDSVEKGRSEPYNLIEIPEFAGDLEEQGDILPQVHDYINQLSCHSNVSAYVRAFPFQAQDSSQRPHPHITTHDGL